MLLAFNPFKSLSWASIDYKGFYFRRLIEKSQRVEAIAASLQSHGADQAQTAEVEDMITPLEKNQLEKYRNKIGK